MIQSIVSPVPVINSAEREEASLHAKLPINVQTPQTSRSSDKKTLQCSYDDCPKTFNRQARLTEHLRSHTDERIFKCPKNGCLKTFLRESHLKAHTKSAHSGIRDYICSWDGCGKGFATGTRLRRHEKTHEEKEKFRCRGYEGCNAVFRKHATLNRHVLSVHKGVRPFPCPYVDEHTGEQCEMAFETAEKLRSHQRGKHDDTRYTCAECLDKTLQNHDDNITTQSESMSEYSFPSYVLLQSHIAMLHPPTCPHCPHISNTRRELKRHIELNHGPTHSETSDIQVFPCTYTSCDRVFTKRGNLTVHITTVHEGRKEFTCGVTDLSSSTGIPRGLTTELEACGRSFTSKSSLEEHVRTSHLGMRSRRAERKSKRKAEIEAADPSLKEPKEKQRRRERRPRPEPSAFAQLTGIRDQEAVSIDLPGYSEAVSLPEHQIDDCNNLFGQYPLAVADMELDFAGNNLPLPAHEHLNAMAIDPHLLTV